MEVSGDSQEFRPFRLAGTSRWTAFLYDYDLMDSAPSFNFCICST